MEIARAPAPGGQCPRQSTIIFVQLSVDDLLLRQPDFDLEGDEAGARVAAAVVATDEVLGKSEAFQLGERRLIADRTATATEIESLKTAASKERNDENSNDNALTMTERRGWRRFHFPDQM